MGDFIYETPRAVHFKTCDSVIIMYLHYKNKQITGILSILPRNEVTFEEEMHNYAFSEDQCLNLKKVMGYNRHRVCKGPACISDLVCFGFHYLFDEGILHKDDIGALILLTSTPDYPVPPTSCVIHGKLGLSHDTICLDINQGCAGYMVGLMQAFMMLEQPEIRKVAIVTADIKSRAYSYRDRSTYPLMGDAATITIVENRPSADIHQFMKMDGAGAMAVWVPAGGMKEPATEDTLRMVENESGNILSRHHVHMKGDEIFNFVLTHIPGMFKDLFAYCGKTFDDVEFFMLHQPNKFILTRIAKKLKLSPEKMPANVVETLGNSSGSTIPNAITLNLSNRLERESIPVCMAGFGSGLVWSATILDLGPLNFCKMIEMDI